jgi:hypothetical protein
MRTVLVSTARTSNIRRHLLKYARHAAEVGFTAAMCSDHFHPWSERQAQSGFAWSWLAAALEATPLSLDSRQLADLATPREFDRACENASRADVLARVLMRRAT